MLCDSQGRPLAVSVYPGNTGDPATLPAQVDTLRRRFGLRRVVLVGDRGLWTQTQIENLRQHRGLGWISALRALALRRLADGGHLQLSLCAGSAGTGERALRVSVDAALRAGIFKASGSFDPMGFWDERER